MDEGLCKNTLLHLAATGRSRTHEELSKVAIDQEGLCKNALLHLAATGRSRTHEELWKVAVDQMTHINHEENP